MKQLLTAGFMTLLIATLAACQSQQGQQIAEAPPPPAFQEDHEFEPVEVEDQDYDQPDPEPMPDAQAPSQAQPEPEPEPEPAQQTHTVADGESLWSIAQEHYGDGQRWEDIVEANDEIDNPDEIYVGQELVLPD